MSCRRSEGLHGGAASAFAGELFGTLTEIIQTLVNAISSLEDEFEKESDKLERTSASIAAIDSQEILYHNVVSRLGPKIQELKNLVEQIDPPALARFAARSSEARYITSRMTEQQALALIEAEIQRLEEWYLDEIVPSPEELNERVTNTAEDRRGKLNQYSILIAERRTRESTQTKKDLVTLWEIYF